MRILDFDATERNIKRLRLSTGLSVRDFQEKLGFALPQAICRWKRELVASKVDNLVILADAFGVEVDDIAVMDRVLSFNMVDDSVMDEKIS